MPWGGALFFFHVGSSSSLNHSIREISFLVIVSNWVVSSIPATMYSLILFSLIVISIKSFESGSMYGEQSKPVSSITSRMAQSRSGSSLLILPLGKPHEALAFHPLTSKHLLRCLLRMTAPQTGTRVLYLRNSSKASSSPC